MASFEINVTGLEVKAGRHIGGMKPHLVLSVEMTTDAVYQAVESMLGKLNDQQVATFLRATFGDVLEVA